MEFCEKLQHLRKEKGITQEELAQALYVSRTAVSKWESGKGYPNIDSLKGIAAYYGVSVDDLLSADQLLSVAVEESQRKTAHLRDMVFGLLDLSAAVLFFLPCFGQRVDGTLQEVSLLSLTAVAPYVRMAYVALLSALTLWGVLVLALQNTKNTIWQRCKAPLSLLLSTAGALAFIFGSQPYAAALLFVFFVIKVLLQLKKG